MIVIFSLVGLSNGQVLYQPAVSSGTPLYSPMVSSGPIYGAPIATTNSAPAAVYGAPAYVAAPAPAPAPAPTSPPTPISPSAFDVYVANQNANAEHISVLGNQVLTNVPLSQLVPAGAPGSDGSFDFLSVLGSAQQGESAARFEDITDQQIQQYKRTHPNPTQADYNEVNDLNLEADSSHQTKLRRAAQMMNSPLQFYFERGAHEDSQVLARNSLYDAQQAYQKSPSADTWRAVVDAQDSIRYQQQRENADNVFLLSSAPKFKSIGAFGSGIRLQADKTQLHMNGRDVQAAQAAYQKDPSTINAMKLHVAQLGLKAWKQDKEENAGFTVGTGAFGGSKSILAFTNLGAWQANQNEEDLWGRYYKASRQLTLMERQQALQKAGGAAAQPNSVQNRLLALSNYGPAPAAAVSTSG